MDPSLRAPLIRSLIGECYAGDCHPELPRASEYHRGHWGGGSATVEEAQLLYALVLATKPRLILETGTETGWTAAHMAKACRANGVGHVWTVECDEEWAKTAAHNLSREGLSDWATIVQMSSLDFLRMPMGPWDFALLDTHIGMRLNELRALRSRLSPQAIVAVHDTEKSHPMAGDCQILRDLKDTGMSVLHIPTPRGLTLLQER